MEVFLDSPIQMATLGVFHIVNSQHISILSNLVWPKSTFHKLLVIIVLKPLTVLSHPSCVLCINLTESILYEPFTLFYPSHHQNVLQTLHTSTLEAYFLKKRLLVIITSWVRPNQVCWSPYNYTLSSLFISDALKHLAILVPKVGFPSDEILKPMAASLERLDKGSLDP